MKFEYQLFTAEEEQAPLIDVLNARGAEGWELVTLEINGRSALLFKRAIQKDFQETEPSVDARLLSQNSEVGVDF